VGRSLTDLLSELVIAGVAPVAARAGWGVRAFEGQSQTRGQGGLACHARSTVLPVGTSVSLLFFGLCSGLAGDGTRIHRIWVMRWEAWGRGRVPTVPESVRGQHQPPWFILLLVVLFQGCVDLKTVWRGLLMAGIGGYTGYRMVTRIHTCDDPYP
jgi:hypothetical protein